MSRQSELFTQFMNAWMGSGFDFDGVAYGYQCVDAYKGWLSLIGYPNPARAIGGDGYAWYIWWNRDYLGLGEYFDYVTGNYQYGDVLIYTKTAETPDSHVGFFVRSNGNGTHQVFGFNQGGDMTGRIITLSDYGILGGLRLKEPKPKPNASGFIDVPESAYYYNPVKWAREKGLVVVPDNQKFNPGSPILRGAALLILYRLKDSPSVATDNVFTDVPANHYAKRAIDWAVEKEITQGTGEHFNPDGALTRAQGITFIWRLAGSPEPEPGDLPFTDVSPLMWFYKPILWAYQKGYVTGKSAKIFDPYGICYRADFVTMLYRRCI